MSIIGRVDHALSDSRYVEALRATESSSFGLLKILEASLSMLPERGRHRALRLMTSYPGTITPTVRVDDSICELQSVTESLHPG